MPRMKAAAALDSRTASSGRDGRLPADFIWGDSTSSYQIEGAVNEDGRGPSVWDGYSKVQGQIAHGDIGDVVCGHWYARLIHAEAMKVLT